MSEKYIKKFIKNRSYLTFNLFHGTESSGQVGRGPVVVGVAAVVREVQSQAVVVELHRGAHHGTGALGGAHQVRHLERVSISI